MKFAIIGCAHAHITHFINEMQKKGHELTGIYDNKKERAQKLQKKYNAPVYDNIEDVIDTGVQIAGTSAENHLKIDIIEKCEDAGIHIMVDKPAVIKRKDLKRLENIILRGKIKIGMLFDVRYWPCMYTLRKLVNDGEIGEVISIEISNPHKLKPEIRESWHFEKEKCGGLVLDPFIHSTDMFNWIINDEITEFKGTMTKSIMPEKHDFFDSAQFLAVTQKGISAYFYVDWLVPSSHWAGDFKIKVTGTKGFAEARIATDHISKKPSLVMAKENESTKYIDFITPEGNPTADFLNKIGGRKSSISSSDIYNANKICIDFDENAKKIYRI